MDIDGSVEYIDLEPTLSNSVADIIYFTGIGKHSNTFILDRISFDQMQYEYMYVMLWAINAIDKTIDKNIYKSHRFTSQDLYIYALVSMCE